MWSIDEESLLLFELLIAPNAAFGELRFQETVTVSSNWIIHCVSQQLLRPIYMSFFHSALLSCWQPFSVMPLSSKYTRSYWGITISGAATVPSLVACSLYLRFCCCCLIYLLITEVEVSQSAEVGSAEGNAPLPFDAISFCIKALLHRYNLISSAVYCFLSLSPISLRTAGKLATKILFNMNHSMSTQVVNMDGWSIIQSPEIILYETAGLTLGCWHLPFVLHFYSIDISDI